MTGPGRQGGSQVDRTILAWDRTALALLGNGVLLLVSDLGSRGGPTLAAAVALAAALVVAVLGRRRAHSLQHGGAALPGATSHAAPRLVSVVGVAVLVVGVAVSAVLLLSAAS